jgi:hypothetical protein
MFYDPTSIVNERHKRAVASIDRPHMLRFFATYQLPVGRRKAVGSDMPKWADAVIGGWELGGSFKATSGSPLSISERRGQPIPLSDPNLHTSVRDRLGDRVDTKTGIPLNPFFNTTVWQRLPDDFTISKEPPRYGWLRGPRTVYTSVTIFKTLNVREGMKFEVRGEVNNPFNTPVFGNPATDMSTPSTFGTITTAGGTRNINLSGKLRF